jgi:putative oxidoreductase
MRNWLYCCPVERTGASVGLLIVRVVIGLAFVFHGWMKVMSGGQFVLTHWMGADAPVPGWLQAVAALVEFLGGGLLVLGLLTRLAALLLAIQMIVALGMVHLPKGDPFVAVGQSSFELPAAYLAISLLFLIAGPGRFSLDALLFGRPQEIITKAKAL